MTTGLHRRTPFGAPRHPRHAAAIGAVLLLCAALIGLAGHSVTQGAEAGVTITGVDVRAIDMDSVEITWTVSEPATGQVHYGTTSSYGLTTTLEDSFDYVTHIQTIRDLEPGTTYHFTVRSEAQDGSVATSTDGTFTTLPASGQPSFEQAGDDVFGSAIAADNLNNAVVGGPFGQSVAFRFRATESDGLESIVVFIIDETHPGYGDGTGGTLRVTVRPDDGSAAHLPSDEVLAELTTDPGDGAGVVYRFPSPARLEKGRLYHVVFENVDPQPERNYVSVDGLFVYDEERVWQPAFPNSDWAHLVRSDDAGWSSDRGSGRGTITPIMGLNYANGQQGGMGYMEVWYREPRPISGAQRVREVFRVPERDLMVGSVAVRLKRVSGTSPLTIRLIGPGESVVFEGQVPATDIAVSDPDADGGSTWARLDLPARVELRSGERYQLVLSSAADTEYSIFPIREGRSYDYGRGSFFDAGTAQYTTGDGWQPFIAWGRPNVEGDLQFYFSDPTAAPLVATGDGR